MEGKSAKNREPDRATSQKNDTGTKKAEYYARPKSLETRSRMERFNPSGRHPARALLTRQK